MKRRTIIGIGLLTAVLAAGGAYLYYASSEADKSAQAVETFTVQRTHIDSVVATERMVDAYLRSGLVK